MGTNVDKRYSYTFDSVLLPFPSVNVNVKVGQHPRSFWATFTFTFSNGEVTGTGNNRKYYCSNSLYLERSVSRSLSQFRSHDLLKKTQKCHQERRLERERYLGFLRNYHGTTVSLCSLYGVLIRVAGMEDFL